MHKIKVGMKLLRKHQKQSLTKCQRGDLVGYGGESGDSGVYIASVGSPSRRCNNFVWTCAALGTYRQVVRVRTVLLTVRPVVAARRPDASKSRPDDWAPFLSGLQESTVRTPYLSRRQ
jgi:hypothetical protein